MSAPQTHPGCSTDTGYFAMKALRSCLPTWKHSNPSTKEDTYDRKIESYRPGYPRFTALISSHDPYVLCRKFGRLRARLLLLKQDKLSMLEQKLDETDREEVSPLFLGKSRCDTNVRRQSILSDIESCLADYDNFVERSSRILSFQTPESRDIKSLQNWLHGTCCLAREEASYLINRRELMSLAPPKDTATSKLESWAEDQLIWLCRGFRKSRFHYDSDDPNVYIYRGPCIQRIAQTLLLLLISFLLLMPVVICNNVNTITTRLAVIMVSIVLYLLVLSSLIEVRTIELIVAGATYTTVLIVFVSGTIAIQG